MPSLTEWKGVELLPTRTGGREGLGVRIFPMLEKLIISKCPLLKSTPNQFEVLRELQIEGVDSEMPLLNLCSNLTSLVKLSVAGVKELTCLPDDMLRNNFSIEHLSFSNCRQFRELPQSLYSLRSLKSLKIHYCTNFSYIPVPSGENHLTSLQSLELANCDGLTSLPSGMLEHCRSLEFLNVYRCNNLVSFPLHFGEMPSLSYMNISECPKLNSVPTGGLHRLTGLRYLIIGPFSEMVDFEAFQLIFNGIQQLSSLRTLWVYGRANLDFSLPHQLMQLSSLKDIRIIDFGIEALPHGLGNLTSLVILQLWRCKRLQHVDFLDATPKLRSLRIIDCPLLEAVSDGLGNLVSLEDLTLSNCEKLQYLPFGDVIRRLTGLRQLEIGPFSEMVDFEAFQSIFNGIQQLSSLRILWVHGGANFDSILTQQLMQLSALTEVRIFGFGIEALPHGLGNLTSLVCLGLWRCKRLQHVDFIDAMPKLRCLWIEFCPLLEALSDGLGNLVSLEELNLWHCRRLQHLPSREVMRRLTKLRYLDIRDCPELEESCSNRSGPNSQWSKISHIPKIRVRGEIIQNLH